MNLPPASSAFPKARAIKGYEAEQMMDKQHYNTQGETDCADRGLMSALQNNFLLLILCHQITFINSLRIHLAAISYNYNGRRGRITLPSCCTAKLIKGL